MNNSLQNCCGGSGPDGLLNVLPTDLKIWVSERKPKMSTEAADMADNYVRAQKQELKRESQRESTGTCMKPWARGQRDRERRSGLPSTLPSKRGKYTSGRKETQRFYWPTLCKDVADFCKSCETCQKTSRVKPQHAPLIPLPIVEERIAMDIVGLLPRSSSGNR